MNILHPQKHTETAVRPSFAILQTCFQILCVCILLTPKDRMFHFSVRNSLKLQRNHPICQDHFDSYCACDLCCCDLQVLHCSTTQTGKEKNGVNSGLCQDLAELPSACKPHVCKSAPKDVMNPLWAVVGEHRAIEYTSIIRVLIWHCCVIGAIKCYRPTIPSWTLTAALGGRLSLLLPVLWRNISTELWSAHQVIIFSPPPNHLCSSVQQQ